MFIKRTFSIKLTEEEVKKIESASQVLSKLEDALVDYNYSCDNWDAEDVSNVCSKLIDIIDIFSNYTDEDCDRC